MTKLNEEAEMYVPPKTGNIADLQFVDIYAMDLFDGSGVSDGQEFKYKFIKIGEQEYRVPNTVLGGIKEVIKKMPQTKLITVTKQGEGKATRYNVMPYTQPVVAEQVKTDEQRKAEFNNG